MSNPSQLQQLGKALDRLLGNIRRTLPYLEHNLFDSFHTLFVELINTKTPQEEEDEKLPVLFRKVEDIRNKYRGLLENQH